MEESARIPGNLFSEKSGEVRVFPFFIRFRGITGRRSSTTALIRGAALVTD